MPVGDTIFRRVEAATDEEIRALCAALGISATGDHGVDKTNISQEYRSAAGNSFANIFRDDHELPYKRILIDVVDKLKPGMGWTDYKIDDSSSEEEIEDAIMGFVVKRVEDQLAKLSSKERSKRAAEIEAELRRTGATSSAASAAGAAVLSGAVGRLVLPLLLGGVVGSLLGMPLIFASLSGPAYRKTVPATVQLIRIRQRLSAEAELGGQ